MSIIEDVKQVFTRRDNALYQLIVINVLVFVAVILVKAVAFFTQASDVQALLMRQIELSSNLGVLLRHPWTVFTYAFTHKGFFHIIFNLLNLYWFGQLIQEYLGDRKLVNIYILGALIGATLFLLSYNLIPVPVLQRGAIVIGASGAVTAIIVAAATLLPDYTFMLLLLGPVKIKWIALGVVLFSLAGVDGSNTGGEIVHLGGALLGFIYIKQLQAGRDLGAPVQAIGGWFGRLASPRPAMQASRPEPVAARRTAAPAGAAKPAGPAQPHAEEVDLILDKISRSGYESLSKDEKQKLFRASQQ